MASPKIFVSSTCYDLSIIRSELRSFMIDLGYEPQMSEFSDILFDPRYHTHSSCIQDISSADMLIVIIGSRFGGQAIPKSIDLIDFEKLKEASSSLEITKNKSNISVTQLEVLKAIEVGIPVFSFVDAGVMNDHFTYEKNKTKSILNDIEFPHIDKQETAKYIFEFINFLKHRIEGNAVTTFTKLDDIKNHLRKQWGSLFQRLLYEQRYKKSEEKRIDFITNQIADIKTAIFTSISSTELKDTAMGAIKFRRLIDFFLSINVFSLDIKLVLKENILWDSLLKLFHIAEIKKISSSEFGYRTVLILDDKTHILFRLFLGAIDDFAKNWEEFRQLKETAKDAIIGAILGYGNEHSPRMAKYVQGPYEEQTEFPEVMSVEVI